MVMKISAWGQKVTSKAMAMGQYTPDMFVKCQWQRCGGVSVRYLAYRWLMAAVFLAVLVASLADAGRSGGTLAHYAKWPIYLTHWGFTLCTVQALLAAYLVTRAHRRGKDCETEAMKMDGLLRMYWVLHNCATIGAFAITTIYWLFVYNPAENKLDAVNLLIHVGNSILMLMDLTVVSHPVRLIDVYWPISFAIAYVIFSVSYYLAGGTDRKGRIYVYKILNWQHPGHSLIVVQLCIVFVLFLHLFVCGFALLRARLAEALKRRKLEIAEERAKHLHGETNEIAINELA